LRGLAALLVLPLLAACGGRGDPAAPAGAQRALTAALVSQGKPIAASSYAQTYAPANADDGDVTTYWESGASAYPATLTVSLGADHDLASLVVKLNPASIWATRTQTFAVLGRAAGASGFTTLVAAATYTFDPAANANTVTIPVTGKASDVQLSFTSNSGAPGAQVAELQVFGAPSGGTTPPPVTPTGTNLALGKAFSASGYTQSFAPANAGDGNTGTYWEGAAGAWPSTLTVDLGSDATLDAVVVKLDPSWGTRTQTYAILGRATAQSAFTTLVPSATYTFTGGSNVVTTGVSGTVRTLQLSFTANSGATGGQAAELEVWGTAGSTPPPPAGQLEAELAALSGGAAVNTNHAGYSGTGFVDGYWTQGARTTFGVQAAAAGWYDVTLHYGNGFGASSLSVYVDGTRALQTPLASTGSWDVWTDRTEVLRLNAGANTVAYAYDPGDGANVNLDYVKVAPTAAQQPNLRVSQITVSAPHSPPVEGDVVTLGAVLANDGTAAAGASRVSFQIGGAEVAAASAGPVAAGGTLPVTATTTWTAGKAGSYTVTAVADSAGAIAELSETDNSTSAALTVAPVPGPDLQVVSITPSPALPSAGQAVGFVVQVANTGTQPAAANTVTRLVVGSATLSGTYGASIDAGTTVTVPIAGTWTAVNGSTTLTATADATNLVAESHEDNNTLASTLYVGRGARVPWDEYEAEDGTYTGALQSGSWAPGTLAGEASHRKAVTLASASQSVQWTSRVAANSIVVRYSVPDNTASNLDLYVNGGFVTRMAVNADFSWMYAGNDNGSLHLAQPTQDAAHPNPHHIYDECHALLSTTGATTIKPGDVVRLQPADASQPITVDFMDLELVAAPLANPDPANLVTVTGFTQNDVTAAISSAMAGGKKGIFLPAGDYVMQSDVYVWGPGFVVQGAGMWHTHLVTGGAKNVDIGFQVGADNMVFQDFAVWGGYDRRVDGPGRAFDGNLHSGTVMQRIWVERMVCGAWVAGGSNLTFRDWRIRNTFADGINLCNGVSNSTIVNCAARNNGDDAFAMWSATDAGAPGPDNGNTISSCTAGLIWRAAGVALYGGYSNLVDSVYVYDTLRYPALTIDSEFTPMFPFSGTTTVQNSTFERCGGLMWWDEGTSAPAPQRKWGAVWIFAVDSDITGIRLTNVDIVDPEYYGVMVQGTGKAVTNTVFNNVQIKMNLAGDYGVVANDSHKSGTIGPAGSISFTNSGITGSRATSSSLFFKDAYSTGFVFQDGGGNTWTGNR
jgi:hypothetical protein